MYLTDVEVKAVWAHIRIELGPDPNFKPTESNIIDSKTPNKILDDNTEWEYRSQVKFFGDLGTIEITTSWFPLRQIVGVKDISHAHVTRRTTLPLSQMECRLVKVIPEKNKYIYGFDIDRLQTAVTKFLSTPALAKYERPLLKSKLLTCAMGNVSCVRITITNNTDAKQFEFDLVNKIIRSHAMSFPTSLKSHESKPISNLVKRADAEDAIKKERKDLELETAQDNTEARLAGKFRMKPFRAVLEDAFEFLTWEEMLVEIEGAKKRASGI